MDITPNSGTIKIMTTGDKAGGGMLHGTLQPKYFSTENTFKVP